MDDGKRDEAIVLQEGAAIAAKAAAEMLAAFPDALSLAADLQGSSARFAAKAAKRLSEMDVK